MEGTVSSDVDLYPPRERALNVALIRAVVYAQDEAAFDAALSGFSEQFHPSVIAELDWMEQVVDEKQLIHAQRRRDDAAP